MSDDAWQVFLQPASELLQWRPPLMPISGKMVNRGVGVGGVFRINVSPAIPASHVVADEVSSSFLGKNGAKLSHQQPSTVDGGQWH